MTARATFFENCDPVERDAYQQLFAAIEALARELGDLTPQAEMDLGKPLGQLPLRLRWAFDERTGCSLRLQHPKLDPETTAILWAFPSKGVEQPATANRVSAMLNLLRDAGVHAADVDAFSEELQGVEFEPTDAGLTLKTKWAGDVEGISRIFRWPANRLGVVNAIRGLITKVNSY
jgi:hypothetical protein